MLALKARDLFGSQGSNPCRAEGGLTQLVECLICIEKVVSSNLTTSIIEGVSKLVDELVLGASAF